MKYNYADYLARYTKQHDWNTFRYRTNEPLTESYVLWNILALLGEDTEEVFRVAYNIELVELLTVEQIQFLKDNKILTHRDIIDWLYNDYLQKTLKQNFVWATLDKENKHWYRKAFAKVSKLKRRGTK
jgi:hypothetical protein